MEKMGEQLLQADVQKQERLSIIKSLSWKLDTQLWGSSLHSLWDKYIQQIKENLAEWSQIDTEVKSFQVRLAWLEKLATFEKNDWYLPFVELLKHQKISALDSLFLTISQSRESASYIEMNWFPTNKTSISLFNREFWTELSADIEINKKFSNADEACVERFVQMYDQLDHNELEGTQTLELLNKLNDWDTSAYIELKELLLENPNELQKLLLAAKKADSLNPESRVFQELTLTLIDIDPSFSDKIRAFEEKYSSSKSLETSYLLSLSGSNIKKEWSALLSRGEENEIITINMWQNPPARKISLDSDSYAIDSNFPLADLHKPELEYQKAYMDTMPKIRAAWFLKTMAVQEHIKDLSEHRAGLNEIKSTLKLCYQIDVSFIENMDDLTTSNLDSLMQKFQNTLDTAMEKYKTWLDVAIQANREKVKEQDKRKREILRFVNWIGFDLIDKQITDSLIQEVKSNSFDVQGLHLDPNRLDIANGMFGESPSEAGWTRWKQNLIEFYNKMISWNPDEPLSVEAHIWMWGKAEDRTQMQYLLKSHWLINESGSFNKDKARENLSVKAG